MKSSQGFAAAGALLVIGIAATVAFAAVELKQVFAPNTHKAQIVQADQQAQAIAAAAADAQAKIAAAEAANATALAKASAAAAAQAQVDQDAAGFLFGATTALSIDGTPTTASKVASVLAQDAAKSLPSPTSDQVAAYRAIVQQMLAENAQLTVALQQKEAEAQANAQAAGVARAAAAKSASDATAANTALKTTGDALVTETSAHAADVKKLDGQVAANESILQRILHFGLGGGILLFILVPLICLAFPEAIPFFKAATSWILGLWHKVHARILSVEQSAHAATKTALTSAQAALANEKANHDATRALLTGTITTPTGAAAAGT